MKKILALVALFFAFASTSAIAKNDYSCDKKFILLSENNRSIKSIKNKPW